MKTGAERTAKYRAKNKEKIAAYKAANKEKHAAYVAKYRAANKEKIAEYYQANKETLKAQGFAYREANQDSCKLWQKQYYKDNKTLFMARDARHKAGMAAQYKALSADEKWMLQEAYELAKLREKVCGGKWEVDHAVPLSKGGLHSPYNVQVVPAAWNRSKHASHSRRMFGAQE